MRLVHKGRARTRAIQRSPLQKRRLLQEQNLGRRILLKTDYYVT